MIDRVHFEKLKSLGDVTLDLGRLTALVGPNGCGKSSVLQGIHLLSQTGLPRKVEGDRLGFGVTFSGARDPRRLASGAFPTTVKLAARDAAGDELTLSIDVPAVSDADPEGDRLSFRVSVQGPEGLLETTVPASPHQNPSLVLRNPRVLKFVSVVYLHLDSSQMMRTWVSKDATPRMGFDGSGLASTLAWMKGAAEEELAQITRDLAQIVPGVTRIRTLRENVHRRRTERHELDGQPVYRAVEETVLGDRFEIEFDGRRVVPADLLSEGTVLALGLLTKLREPKRPRLVLLDDIDRGLHIEAQGKLVGVLRMLLEQDPELQIVCTTHSPYLLDRFEPSEVRVLALDENRQTRACALTDHPEFEKWKFGTQTGELWAALGEAWVAHRRGAAE
jgi:predicted ATPase